MFRFYKKQQKNKQSTRATYEACNEEMMYDLSEKQK